MISCRQAPDGYQEIRIEGNRSHLDAKALQHLIGRVCGRGKAEGRIGQQNVRIVVVNDGMTGESHSAVSEA